MKKGYFLGATREKDDMLLCFRDSHKGEIFFGRYDGWKPKEYIITSVQKSVSNVNKLKKYFDLDAEISDKRYGKYTKIKGKPLSVIEVRLNDFREKNLFWKKINESGLEDLFAIYPDTENSRSYEFGFYQDMKMVWQVEYEMEEEQAEKTAPDGSPIYQTKKIEPTGEINKKIGIITYDIESNVKNWDIVLLSSVTSVPGEKEEKNVYVHVPPNWSERKEEFGEKFIRNDEELYEKYSPFNLLLCSTNEEILKKFSGQLSQDLRQCDVLSGFNVKDYDQSEIYRVMKSSDVSFKGKGGYKLTLRPVANTGFTFSGPGLWNLDDFYFVNKGRLEKLKTSRKRLRDVERRLGFPQREGEISGLSTWRLYDQPELYTKEMRHNLNDIMRTKKITEIIIDKWRGQNDRT